MGSTSSFRHAVTELEMLQRELGTLSQSQAVDWKRDLLRLRRQLQIHLTLVGQSVNDSAAFRERPEMARRFRDAFSAMRSTLALHQANWPAVQIDRADPDYQTSVNAVRNANRHFMTVANEIAPHVES